MFKLCRDKIHYEAEKIEINKIFDKARSNPFSDEYAALQKVRADYPSFTVCVRKINTNPKKDTYKGLTYEWMNS